MDSIQEIRKQQVVFSKNLSTLQQKLDKITTQGAKKDEFNFRQRLENLERIKDIQHEFLMAVLVFTGDIVIDEEIDAEMINISEINDEQTI